MFGGLAFMLDGNMALGVRDDELMVRLGADDVEEALAEPHTRRSMMGERPMKGIVLVAQRRRPRRLDRPRRRARAEPAAEVACRPPMKIIYTYTDEAPALATHSFLPIIEAFAGAGRRRGRAARHLARRAHPRPVPGPPDEDQRCRRARRARRAGQDARGEHHQAAEHQRVDPAAEGGDQGAPGRRATTSRTTRTTRDDERAARERVRQRQGQRGQPGAARGQLRPPRARVGQGVRPQAPALDGRVVEGLQVARLDDERGRLPLDRAVGDGGRRRRAADRARRRRRHGDRAQGRRSRCSRARSSTPR